MAGMAPEPGAGGGGKAGLGYRRLIGPLLVPTWVMIGIFLVLPVLLLAVSSCLTLLKKKMPSPLLLPKTMISSKVPLFIRGIC